MRELRLHHHHVRRAGHVRSAAAGTAASGTVAPKQKLHRLNGILWGLVITVIRMHLRIDVPHIASRAAGVR